MRIDKKKPLVLTIGGFDPSSGAGITADLKIFKELNTYGLSVISAITAQNSKAVFDVFTPPANHFKNQLEALLSDLHPKSIKIGMLSTKENVLILKEQLLKQKKKQVVLDPIFVSTSGKELLSNEGQKALADDILPLSLAITPNIAEAEVLAGVKIKNIDDLERAASIINDLGPKWVIIKGGHANFNNDFVEDFVFDGTNATILKNKRLDKQVRGTGCMFAASIAAYLAQETNVLKAIELAREYIQGKIEKAMKIGGGREQI